MKKLLTLAAIAVVATAFFMLDLHHWLTLEGLKSGLSQFEHWRTQSPLLTAGSFFLLYILVTALSLPGAAIMTLAGGALFGLWQGVLLVSFASTIGATLAFLVSRYLLRDWVQSRFGARLDAINRGIERDGALYLFTLRLVPAFPFFLINLLMGLTPIKARTFYWVSQVGMLAGTLVYVNAGTQVAQLEALAGILSPELLTSFALLGLFPLLAKKVMGLIQRRRVYARWQKPARFDRNLIVIGAGAGGLVSAYIAAAVKAKVTLIEAHKMGGDCLNYGCVPSKALIKSARMAQQMRQAERYGLNATEPGFSFRTLMSRIHEVISQVAPHDSIERYTELGVDVLQGHARLIDPWTVEVRVHDGQIQRLTARSIILATGASPAVPPLPGLDETGYVTSDTLWETFAKRDTPPQHLVVLGGGPIGCELAQSFGRLGSKVTQVVHGARLMPREDEEVSTLVQTALQDEGVHVLTEHTALRTERRDGRNYLICRDREQEVRLEFDELLIAVGRKPRLSGYGLETLGIETDHTVTTNAYLETLYPNIYAVGDVAGPYQFTHTAAHQAWYAAVNALFGQFKRFRADYNVIPWTTFTAPEVARVGLNEQEAIERGIAHEVTRYGLDDLDRAITESERTGFVKVLTEPGKDRILGACIVGEHAGELLAEFVLAMKYGLGLNKILGTIHTYPTWAEANKYAAGEWKKAHAPKVAMKWLARYHAWRRG
ncbi:FAD-dependent oxidoreductase [Marinobacterium sediminicola]|uniref:Pyruvate/2-oxoglutarate dehydrogenase complex, dihydrolipoamide dehydrogenase (E3) component n=1 Tax=Marinobacterium sediminicola TaxID=518898 RepID=A0ABY1S2J6_9GAMM|nr:bifunctional TVP38/TMEM64 family protein/FAD-dependent oxidoreductase [Marinobacterium sediminicola]ULG70687.1 FAD-dependent oxidoreductase [Marinobacterium sediminicola]SMR77228.1 Pyruvate/2-oxoglutarate dehydrogenase complex, dihydrolipoamide dehydrogenase (E3) component [Marinobacterium sediminicola]